LAPKALADDHDWLNEVAAYVESLQDDADEVAAAVEAMPDE
jgi:hypothetical protein